MLPKKLSFKIGFFLALSILIIEALVILSTVVQEKRKQVDEKVRLLDLVTQALSGDFDRSIRYSHYLALSQTLSEVARQFGADSLVLFDHQG
ncbi:MAG TPA: hypothetical protein VFR02_10145, partial [bacterium]|nr:hypothetical protein [bacterium]